MRLKVAFILMRLTLAHIMRTRWMRRTPAKRTGCYKSH